MPATLIGSNTYAFADGNAGHVIDLGSSPSVGQTDVLCVNSDTVVTTPSGFALDVSRVNSQGSYIYRRKAVGGEGQTVTITTSGNNNTSVSWLRWGGLNAKDATANSGVDGVAGTSSPAHSSGTMTASTELIIAFAALHSFGAVPSSPVWANSYTGQTAVTQGSGSTGAGNFVGYKQPVGTAAESPSVSWTGNVSDRYMLTITFTITGGLSGTAGTATETDTAQPIGKRKTRAVGTTSTTDTAQPIGRRKTRAVGVASEADTAGTLGKRKTRALAVAGGTDTAGTITRTKTRAVGTASDASATLTLGRLKARVVGTATTTDTARTLTAGHLRALGTAAEVDTARTITTVHAIVRAVGTALEVDTAPPVTASGGLPVIRRPTIDVVTGPLHVAVVDAPAVAVVAGGVRVVVVSDG
ncbi:MAG TPA: hypothetical protein VF516_00165 [Kofleriaceae bacterium]